MLSEKGELARRCLHGADSSCSSGGYASPKKNFLVPSAASLVSDYPLVLKPTVKLSSSPLNHKRLYTSDVNPLGKPRPLWGAATCWNAVRLSD